MENPEFRRIVKIEYIRIGKTNHRVHNSNLLIGSYQGANGVKTGWTDDAGYSVVASAKRGGTELFAVVLGTPSEATRFAEARSLLDWGFAHYRTQQLATKGTVVAEASGTRLPRCDGARGGLRGRLGERHRRTGRHQADGVGGDVVDGAREGGRPSRFGRVLTREAERSRRCR